MHQRPEGAQSGRDPESVADVNGDGNPDVLVANFCVSKSNCSGDGLAGVLLNNTGIHDPTSTSLTSGLNPSIYGGKVTLTATVKPAGKITPTGKVTFAWKFFTETFTIGSATLNSS